MSSKLVYQDKNSSNNDVVIRARNLSKVYQVYETPNDRLKQYVVPRLKRLLGRNVTRNYFSEFRVLNELTFSVHRGEALGIIGRNGAGKSTLLQLICGTLHPTAGEVEVKGRVAALLELGSGFNPEFTGRENVYMNASILGLSTKEIDDRFDKIAAFADIGKYLEQPVKTYSSGMFARLAFAVIAHVDADILIVDEALAVGDAVFIQKCMRFIRAFREKGTLLFVSHDMGSVRNLCETAMWLSNGEVKGSGSPKTVTESYLSDVHQQEHGETVLLSETAVDGGEGDDDDKSTDTKIIDYASNLVVTDNLNSSSGWKTGDAEILKVIIESLDGGDVTSFEGGEKVRLTVTAVANKPLTNPIIGFLWRDRLGQDLFGENTLPFTNLNPISVGEGQRLWAYFDFSLPYLPNGKYVVMCSIADGDLYDHVQHNWLNDALVVNVSSSKVRFGLMGIEFKGMKMGLNDD
jgi:lipopolysaccharide transport system ATP-binding protein